jgi:hypothetical protein
LKDLTDDDPRQGYDVILIDSPKVINGMSSEQFFKFFQRLRDPGMTSFI